MKKIKFAIFDESKNVLSEDILKTKFKTNEVWKMNLEETPPQWCPAVVCHLYAGLQAFFATDMNLFPHDKCVIYVCGDSAISDSDFTSQQKSYLFYCYEQKVEAYVETLYYYVHTYNLLQAMQYHAVSFWSGHHQNLMDEAAMCEPKLNHMQLLRDTLISMDCQLKAAYKSNLEKVESLISHTW